LATRDQWSTRFCAASQWYDAVLLFTLQLDHTRPTPTQQQERKKKNRIFPHFSRRLGACAVQVPADQVLPLFYLSDSILKNEGAVYRHLFSLALPAALVDVYQRNAGIRIKLRSLVKSWLPTVGSVDGVFAVQTLAALQQQLDSVDRAALVAAPPPVSSSLLSALSAAFPSQPHMPFNMPPSQPPPVFVPQPTIASLLGGSASLAAAVNKPAATAIPAAAVAATTSAIVGSVAPVMPFQLLELLQPTLENAMRVQTDSARAACANLRMLVTTFTNQANAAASRASPHQQAATLYQRLIAHRQGAALELSDLMPHIVHGWTAPVVQPSAQPVGVAAVAGSRKRGHTDISAVPNLGNLGQLRAPGGGGAPPPSLRAESAPMMGIHPARAAAMQEDERRRTGQPPSYQQPAQASRQPEAPRRSQSSSAHTQNGRVPLEFDAAFLKSDNAHVIHAVYDAMSVQCAECGMRFAQAGAESRKHADWHFEINRRDKQRLERPSARQWYAKPIDWKSNVDSLDAPLEEVMLARLFEQSKPATATGDDAANAATAAHDAEQLDNAANGARVVGVPSDDAQSACPVCGDKFVEFWSEADDEWMFRDAVYEPDADKQRIVHVKCQRK
jgi:hypothetical protein